MEVVGYAYRMVMLTGGQRPLQPGDMISQLLDVEDLCGYDRGSMH